MEHVTRSGLVFRCGEYTDKDFSLTPDEARAAIAAFRPVPVDLEHTSTVLDGRLGMLESVAMGEDGETIMGQVRLPQWLDALLDEGQRKVSATWDRATKTLQGLAIVNTPRVSDAVLMAAFAATDEGKSLVAVEAVFAEAPKGAKEQRMTTTQVTTTSAATQPSRMQRFFAWLEGEGDAAFSESTEATASVAQAAPVESEEIKALKAQIAALQDKGIADAATAFAAAEIQAGRAFPAERDALVAAFADAAADDRAAPRTVTFADSEGKAVTGSRVDALKARHAARTPHDLTTERLDDKGIALNAKDTTAPVKMSDERKKRLIALTGVQMKESGS